MKYANETFWSDFQTLCTVSMGAKNEILVGGQNHLPTSPSHFTVCNPFLKAITDLI